MAFVGPVNSAHHIQQRALTAAAVAKQDEKLALVDIEAHILKNRARASPFFVGFGESYDADHRFRVSAVCLHVSTIINERCSFGESWFNFSFRLHSLNEIGMISTSKFTKCLTSFQCVTGLCNILA